MSDLQEVMSSNPEGAAYLKSLFDQIIEEGLNGRTLTEAVHEAHEGRQAIILELAVGETERAQIVRNEIQDRVWDRLSK